MGFRTAFRDSLRPHQESVDSLPQSIKETYEQILGRVMRNIMLRYVDVLSTIDTYGLVTKWEWKRHKHIQHVQLESWHCRQKTRGSTHYCAHHFEEKKALGPVCRQARPLPRLYGLSSNPNDKRLARHLSLRIISSTKHRVASHITGVLRHDRQIFTLFGL